MTINKNKIHNIRDIQHDIDRKEIREKKTNKENSKDLINRL